MWWLWLRGPIWVKPRPRHRFRFNQRWCRDTLDQALKLQRWWLWDQSRHSLWSVCLCPPSCPKEHHVLSGHVSIGDQHLTQMSNVCAESWVGFPVSYHCVQLGQNGPNGRGSGRESPLERLLSGNIHHLRWAYCSLSRYPPRSRRFRFNRNQARGCQIIRAQGAVGQETQARGLSC